MCRYVWKLRRLRRSVSTNFLMVPPVWAVDACVDIGLMVGAVLRNVTGWGLVTGAIGVFWDEVACGGCAEGSLGLVPLYVGLPIGLIGLVIVFWKTSGLAAAVLAGLGSAALFYFMGSYPDGAEGWLGAVLVGVAHLWLPLVGRAAVVPWLMTGLWDVPEYQVAASWGPLNGFVLLGISAAWSGAYVLLGHSSKSK